MESGYIVVHLSILNAYIMFIHFKNFKSSAELFDISNKIQRKIHCPKIITFRDFSGFDLFLSDLLICRWDYTGCAKRS